MIAVERLILEGQPRHTIVAAMRRRFGIAPSTTDDYAAKVRERWTGERAAALPGERAETIARLTADARTMRRQGAWASLIQCERLLADVRGLRSQSTVTLTAPAPAAPDMSHAEALEELAMAAEVLGHMKATTTPAETPEDALH
jgi:hypothetical protein